MHLLSKEVSSSGELDTLRKSRTPTTVVTASGEVQILEDTPAVLSLGKLCEEHGPIVVSGSSSSSARSSSTSSDSSSTSLSPASLRSGNRRDPSSSAENRLLPSHKIRQGTNDETTQVSAQKFTVLRHKNWSCKYMEDMYCDCDDNNVILLPVINTFYTCQADVDTKMTVGTLMCIMQNGEMRTIMCTVGTSTCLFCSDHVV